MRGASQPGEGPRGLEDGGESNIRQHEFGEAWVQPHSSASTPAAGRPERSLWGTLEPESFRHSQRQPPVGSCIGCGTICRRNQGPRREPTSEPWRLVEDPRDPDHLALKRTLSIVREGQLRCLVLVHPASQPSHPVRRTPLSWYRYISRQTRRGPSEFPGNLRSPS